MALFSIPSVLLAVGSLITHYGPLLAFFSSSVPLDLGSNVLPLNIKLLASLAYVIPIIFYRSFVDTVPPCRHRQGHMERFRLVGERYWEEVEPARCSTVLRRAPRQGTISASVWHIIPGGVSCLKSQVRSLVSACACSISSVIVLLRTFFGMNVPTHLAEYVCFLSLNSLSAVGPLASIMPSESSFAAGSLFRSFHPNSTGQVGRVWREAEKVKWAGRPRGQGSTSPAPPSKMLATFSQLVRYVHREVTEHFMVDQKDSSAHNPGLSCNSPPALHI